MRDYLQRAAIRAPNRIRVKKKTPPEGRVGKFMERATGLEPANTSLGSLGLTTWRRPRAVELYAIGSHSFHPKGKSTISEPRA